MPEAPPNSLSNLNSDSFERREPVENIVPQQKVEVIPPRLRIIERVKRKLKRLFEKMHEKLENRRPPKPEMVYAKKTPQPEMVFTSAEFQRKRDANAPMINSLGTVEPQSLPKDLENKEKLALSDFEPGFITDLMWIDGAHFFLTVEGSLNGEKEKSTYLMAYKKSSEGIETVTILDRQGKEKPELSSGRTAPVEKFSNMGQFLGGLLARDYAYPEEELIKKIPPSPRTVSALSRKES